MRYTPKEIEANLELIKTEIDREIDEENPVELISKLNRLSSLLGNSSKCFGSAVFYYKKDSKIAEYHELKNWAEVCNKDMHYCIVAIQSMLSFIKADMSQSRNQI